MSSVLTAAENFTVVVYKRGATANGAQSGTLTNITVRNGALRWASGNKGMVGLTPARYFTVSGTPANDTTIPVTAVSLSILDGERLVNLGTDTGSSTPNYDGSGVSIYSVNSDGATAVSQSRITTDGHGEYAYYVAPATGIVDELVLSSTTPVELIEDVNAASPHRAYSPEIDGASAVGHALDTERAYSTSGAKLVSFRNATVEKSYISKDGNFVGPVTSTGLTVTGDAALTNLTVSGATTLQGATAVQSGLSVTGVSTLIGAVNASAALTANTVSGVTVTGTAGMICGGGLDIVGQITQSNAAAINAFSGFMRLASNVAGFGGSVEIYAMSEELSLVGVTVRDSTANLLPANSIILGVTARITSTITGGGVTGWDVGDTANDTRFITNNTTLTAGTTAIGLNHWKASVSTEALGPTQAANDKVQVDVIGGTATTGRIRITVFYMTFIPSTS